ncbi:hypothetical protein G6F63_016218 [Rhizopus arrhizus]|nr:hypothetical protein G6F63_016218 [Rhizopus arrhizus]
MRACSEATCAAALDTCSVLATPWRWRASVRRLMSWAMLRLSSVIARNCRVARSCSSGRYRPGTARSPRARRCRTDRSGPLRCCVHAGRWRLR